MVKLATARESRMYGPRLGRNRSEYMNAGFYLFATILLLSGYSAQLSNEPRSGLVLMLIGCVIIIGVNIHDLMAHLAGIDFRFPLMEYDIQLGLVEFGVPVIYTVGTILYFLGVVFIFMQAEKGYGYFRVESHALNLLVAGPAFWVIGSIHNSCQIYERAGGHVQILQESVIIPLLLASFLFLVAAILNCRDQIGHHHHHHGLQLLGDSWIWLGISASLLLFIGGLTNVVKVFKMQQIDGLRLEKLRGGAQELLVQIREGQVPLIVQQRQQQQQRRRPFQPAPAALPPTPYKDALLAPA